MTRYFITYYSAQGFGNCEIIRTRREGKIKTMADVKEIEKAIAEELGARVTIQDFKRWR